MTIPVKSVDAIERLLEQLLVWSTGHGVLRFSSLYVNGNYLQKLLPDHVLGVVPGLLGRPPS